MRWIPLELALLLEAAEGLAGPEDDDRPPGEMVQRMVARTMRRGELPMARRYIKQILRPKGTWVSG
jgi:hypothetical protein